ncbi:YncE family protein [Desulfolucanica intricata]|uniref:YncE family protein n=1 Tax=Desulfolucanica intricata TaxID=1285191 RepID=UPI00082A2857|nr:hypothetical protein [Desulfolucanica intricata]
MIKKFVIMLCAILAISIFIYVYYEDSPASEQTYINKNSGIYCLTASRDVFYLSSEDYKILNKITVEGGWKITPVQDGKIYITVRGSLSKAGKEIAVLQNGKVIKNIELNHLLPRIIKYNEYNRKAYVGHIFYKNKNYITVINTEKDLVENYLSYDKNIEDIAFIKNKMIISAWAPKGKPYQIDIISLDNYSVTKTIPIDFIMSSMIVVGDMIYGINGLSQEPFLYVIDWKKEKVVEKIRLKENSPWRVYKNEVDGKSYVYVSHYNIDNMSGKSISCVDPENNEVVKTITNAFHPGDIAFNNKDIIVGDRVNDRLLIINGNKIKHKVYLGSRPLIIVKAKSLASD